jgi:hypothetical protein
VGCLVCRVSRFAHAHAHNLTQRTHAYAHARTQSHATRARTHTIQCLEDSALVFRQPYLSARLLLQRAELSPHDMTGELSDALAAAVDGGRAALARRVCVTGVQHALAMGDHASVHAFVAAGNVISAACRRAKDGSASLPIVSPHNAVFGSIGNAAASAMREVRRACSTACSTAVCAVYTHC